MYRFLNPNGAQRESRGTLKTRKSGDVFGSSSQDPPKGAKWSQNGRQMTLESELLEPNGAKMNPKTRSNGAKISKTTGNIQGKSKEHLGEKSRVNFGKM